MVRPGTRWFDAALPENHEGPCDWRHHPIHRLRSWAVYLIASFVDWRWYPTDGGEPVEPSTVPLGPEGDG